MKWHHSLYWRIAAGFVTCLALLLVVQAMLFVFVVARSGPAIPNQPPERFAQVVALDLAQALERDASIDIEHYLGQEYERDTQPFFVVLADRRVITIGGSFPAATIQEAQLRLEMVARGWTGRMGRGFRGGFGPSLRPETQGPGQPFERGEPLAPGQPFGRLEPGPRPFGRMAAGRPFRPAPIIVADRVAGLVVVPPQPPFTFLLRRYAPTLGLVALATLVVGAALATAVIFGPARRRLRAVEQAAQRLGSGDLTARAPAAGNDEVAAVATAFNAMANDLAARAEALAASDRARRQLLADVSHELTTPITAMRGYLETLSMPEMALDTATKARYLGIIGDETARLERIIGDLLDLARLEGGGGTLTKERVPMAPLFERVVARHERAAAQQHVEFRMNIEPRAETVYADKDRLEQALQNLAANALRYAPDGTSIDLEARARDGAIDITISDHGPGIAPEHLPRVFDRFYKVEASRPAAQEGAAGGSGLGLSIVKAIVERHGGSVSVESQPGRTVFALHLPDTTTA